MRFTLSLPMCPADQMVPVARAAEEAGWHAVSLPDSVFYPAEVSALYPYTSDGSRFWPAEAPWVEPTVAIAAMAAVTTRLRFYTNIYKVTLRHPLLVAKAVGSLAALSGDRVGLGVGLSWIPEEFAWLGRDMSTRGARLDEEIEVIRLALTDGFVEHHGEHYDFGSLRMAPAPSGLVPIYVGGHSAPALRRAARLGDGWIGAQLEPAELGGLIDRLRRLLDEQGRDPAAFEFKATPLVAPTVEATAPLIELGLTDVITVPWYFYGDGDPDALDTKLDSVRRYADEVIAPLTGDTA